MPDLFVAAFYVTLDGPRGEVFERILGSRTVPVLSPIATPCRLDIGVRDCFLLDVAALTIDQFWSLTEFLVERHGTSIYEEQDKLRNKGMAILAEEYSQVLGDARAWL